MATSQKKPAKARDPNSRSPYPVRRGKHKAFVHVLTPEQQADLDREQAEHRAAVTWRWPVRGMAEFSAAEIDTLRAKVTAWTQSDVGMSE